MAKHRPTRDRFEQRQRRMRVLAAVAGLTVIAALIISLIPLTSALPMQTFGG